MTAASDDHKQSQGRAKGLSDQQRRRDERLAMELRANLKRRKAQARARDDEGDATRLATGSETPKRDGSDGNT